jgi:hypothetical protein
MKWWNRYCDSMKWWNRYCDTMKWRSKYCVTMKGKIAGFTYRRDRRAFFKLCLPPGLPPVAESSGV